MQMEFMKKENKAIWLCLSFKLAPSPVSFGLEFCVLNFTTDNHEIRSGGKKKNKTKIGGIIRVEYVTICQCYTRMFFTWREEKNSWKFECLAANFYFLLSFSLSNHGLNVSWNLFDWFHNVYIIERLMHSNHHGQLSWFISLALFGVDGGYSLIWFSPMSK